MADTGSPGSSSLFLTFSIHLSFVSGWGEAKAVPSYSALKGWGSWSLVLLFLSQEGKFFLVGEFPLGSEECWLGEWVDAAKMKLFFLPFLCCYRQVPSLLKFLKWTSELSQSCFVHG